MVHQPVHVSITCGTNKEGDVANEGGGNKEEDLANEGGGNKEGDVGMRLEREGLMRVGELCRGWGL